MTRTGSRKRILLPGALLLMLYPAVQCIGDEIGVCNPDPLAMMREVPAYPMIEARRPDSGYAVVEFTVTSAGEVTDAKLIESGSEPTSKRFEAAYGRLVVAAIQNWKFEEQPRDCRTKMKLPFEMEDDWNE